MTGRFGTMPGRWAWRPPGTEVCGKGEFEMSASIFSKKLQKKGMTALAFCFFSGILKANGCGNPEHTAAVAPVNGGDSHTNFDDFIESVGRSFCSGVTVCTFTTPTGSFFVSGVVTGGKSHNSTHRRLKCLHAPTTSAPDTPPHVSPARWRPG